jgi:hypothetical protein
MSNDATIATLLRVIDPDGNGPLENTARRAIALQALCEERGLLPPNSVAIKMQELDLDSIAEIELGPQHEEWRRLRDQVRGEAGEGEGEET